MNSPNHISYVHFGIFVAHWKEEYPVRHSTRLSCNPFSLQFLPTSSQLRTKRKKMKKKKPNCNRTKQRVQCSFSCMFQFFFLFFFLFILWKFFFFFLVELDFISNSHKFYRLRCFFLLPTGLHWTIFFSSFVELRVKCFEFFLYFKHAQRKGVLKIERAHDLQMIRILPCINIKCIRIS